MLRFDIITLFPNMFESPFAESIISRAKKDGKIEIETHQLRDWATDKHHTTDDTPYGGGPGMVIKVDVVDKAIEATKKLKPKTKNRRIVMLSASGQRFSQQKAIEISKYDNIILLCGHYEGFDHRVHEHLIDEEISIGEYVLTGGEIPAMVIIDAVTRMIPGVINEQSILSESFMPPKSQKSKFIGQNCNSKVKSLDAKKLIPNAYNLNFDYPVYTRPVEYKGWRVPEVLQNGNHTDIEKWRNDFRKRDV